MQKIWLIAYDSLPYIHAAAAVFWVGSLFFMAAVLAPVMEKVRPPSFQRMLAKRVWRAAHTAMWIAAAVVILTAVMILRIRGELGMYLLSPGSLLTPMGQKLALFLFMVAVSLVHDLWLGYGARVKDPDAATDVPSGIAVALPWFSAFAGLAAVLISMAL